MHFCDNRYKSTRANILDHFIRERTGCKMGSADTSDRTIGPTSDTTIQLPSIPKIPEALERRPLFADTGKDISETDTPDTILRLSDITSELEVPFDDGETIEEKAANALDHVPRSQCIRILEHIDYGKRAFSTAFGDFMRDKPDNYVVTGNDMKSILSDLFRATKKRH